MGYEYKYKPCGTVKAETLPFSPGKNINPNGIHGPITVKIPVVLAEKEVQVDVEATIDIKDDFFEVKRVKKNVFLTQCKLLPHSGQKDCDGKLISGKLFIKGFVEKNIEYATLDDCEHSEVKTGHIKHATAKVPFHAVTEVFFDTPPIFKFRVPGREFDFFQRDMKEPCEDVEGKLLCETGFEEEVFYLDKPFCRLESAKIFEIDVFKEDKKKKKHHYDKKDDECKEEKHEEKEEEFGKIIEKMVVNLRIKVLQEQQVDIK